MFVHDDSMNLPKSLERVMIGESRQYISPKTNEGYTSVTTFLSRLSAPYIARWRKNVGEEEANRVSRVATSRGTSFHKMVENLLNNEENPSEKCIDPVNLSGFNKITPLLIENLSLIYGLEQPLYSDTLKLAGTADLGGVWKGKPAIVDFKTSAKKKTRSQVHNYFMQCAAYSLMVEELTGVKFNDLVILMSCEATSDIIVFEEERSEWSNKLVDLLAKHRKGIDISNIS